METLSVTCEGCVQLSGLLGDVCHKCKAKNMVTHLYDANESWCICDFVSKIVVLRGNLGQVHYVALN